MKALGEVLFTYCLLVRHAVLVNACIVLVNIHAALVFLLNSHATVLTFVLVVSQPVVYGLEYWDCRLENVKR